jgi:transcriptional regulator with XRE-family HTH domain
MASEGARTLRQLREESGLTQFQVAQQLGVTITTVSSWERDASEPGGRHLQKLARLYGVSPFDIMLPEIERGRRGKAAGRISALAA